MFNCLVGRAYHHSAPRLEAKLFEHGEALAPALCAHPCGVQQGIMLVVTRLVSEQIAVGPCTTHRTVGLGAALAHRQRYGLVGVTFFYRADNVCYPSIILLDILAALQHKSVKAQRISHAAALENLILAQTVALGRAVTASEAAIIAIIAAIRAYLYKAANKNPSTEILFGHTSRLASEKLHGLFIIARREQRPPIGALHWLSGKQFFYYTI